jgi:hypothetical protein
LDGLANSINTVVHTFYHDVFLEVAGVYLEEHGVEIYWHQLWQNVAVSFVHFL